MRPVVHLRVFPSLATALMLALTPTAGAQTGPWQDGELLVLALPASGGQSLRRIVPETGASADLVTGMNSSFTPGALAFDTFRGGLVACLSLQPDPVFQFKPWVISHDGSAVALPGLDWVSLRALCSTGSGNLYFQRNDIHVTAIEYYDAGNQLQTLKDSGGVAPLALRVQHMLYDAVGNALIGAISWNAAGTGCTTGVNSVYRIPLSNDGSKVQGTVTCTSWQTALQHISGLDALPNGQMLITLDSGVPNVDGRIALVDPSGPTVSGWANPAPTNLRGGCYSSRLGKAVVFDDFFAVLRAYNSGQSGDGAVLNVDTPFDTGTTGPNATNRILELDVLGPGCNGFHNTYGAGLAGMTGIVPKLSAVGCPDVDTVFSVILDDVLGAAPGMIFAGLAPGVIPFKGGTFLLGNVALQLSVVVSGFPGNAGAGDLALPVLFDHPIYLGVDIYVQAAFADIGAVKGVSLTNGLRIQPN